MSTTDDGATILDRQLASTLESVDEAEAAITAMAGANGFDEDALFRIGMAVREGMVNAVVHGNRYSESKRVHLTASFTGGRLAIRIADEGDGFDLTAIPDPTAEENLLRQSGRGLLLIRSFVDEVRIGPAEPHGTALELVKHLG